MKKLIIILAVLVFFIIPASADDVMKFGFSEAWKPFDWQEKGEFRGLFVDIANEAIQKRMGISVSHHIYPWERAQHLVREGVLDAIITNGPLRKEWAKFSNEVLIELEWKIYVKTSSPKLEKIKRAKSLEELRPFEFVDYIGNGWAKANLVDKNFNVYLVALPSNVFELLAKGRGDINIIPAIMGKYYLKELGLQNQIIELPPVTPAISIHLVIGKKSHFIDILPKFDNVVKDMKKDGSLQAIIDKYNK